MTFPRPPGAVGLYDPANEKDACGVGFVAHLKGRASHDIVRSALTVLENMSHRGACGSDPLSGDGAGLLVGMPDPFLRVVVQRELACELPPPGRWAAGLIFLPADKRDRQICKGIFERYVQVQGQRLIGWRPVPTSPDLAKVGPSARAGMPVMEMVFIGAARELDADAFERQLYLIRKQAYHAIRACGLEHVDAYYVCSLSSRVLVYKGQLTSHQLSPFFPDLADPAFGSHLAMVHSRFSTNTFPSWDRAQPMRYLCHNGEINTLKGNATWMRARQGLFRSPAFGDELRRLYPIIDPETSDSGIFDNVLELLVLAGRPLSEAMMMMAPEAWQNDPHLDPHRRAFYEYHANLMEPWDGPATVMFTDGRQIGAVLDRNGLRPARWLVTHDDRVVMASEAGVLDIPAARVKAKGRVEPGRMFLLDFGRGAIVADDELKLEAARKHPYAGWLAAQRFGLSDLEPAPAVPGLEPESLPQRLAAFGYTHEHLRLLLEPMVRAGLEPLGSMGNDAALACLSRLPRLVPDYFQQLFAQVTNPPIDSIREAVFMSLECPIGPEGNLLATTERQAARLWLAHPVLGNDELAAIKYMDHNGWRAWTIDATWARGEGPGGMRRALDRIAADASQAIVNGYSVLILSDRALGPDRVPVPMLLAVGAVHQHLVRTADRTQAALIVESGEPREVHHHCALLGYGADAVNPYLAFEALWQARRDSWLDAALDEPAIVARYRAAVGKALRKVMGKMGISTLQSYKGAQIFEAVGLAPGVIDTCFTGTVSRIGGVGFDVLAEEALARHRAGYAAAPVPGLPNPGEYQWRPGGEQHMWSPEVIGALQEAARTGAEAAYAEFARAVNEETHRACALRGLFAFRATESLPLDQVEPAADIVRRFSTGAMSYGSISREAHETLAVAMNRVGGKSNTGEGGEDYARFAPRADGSSARSAIKQVASGRFGVTGWYLANADQLQIKIAQGAKPGEGGELPGHKVSADIAKTRHTTPGVTLISPPPHHDIYSIEDLAQLVHDLKNANPSARISVKLVSEVGVGTVAAGVAKAKADHILVSGHEGGTGASPLTGIKHAGLPWELGLAEAHQTLVLNDLRSRVRLEVDGQLKTGRDVVIAALLGAEEFGFATAPLVALGCVLMRKCHLNTCPVGIATQDPGLRARFPGQPEHVITYLYLVAEEVRRLLAGLGLKSLDAAIGRVDLLEARPGDHPKASSLDLSAILKPAAALRPGAGVRKTCEQEHGLAGALDHALIEEARAALEGGGRVRIERRVRNVNRTVGTLLSHALVKRHGPGGLPDGSIHVKLAGSAGQSLGAFLAPGVTLELEGDANDAVGKGLSGGRVIAYPPRASTFAAEDGVLVGNVALYGAVSGAAFLAGRAAERFAVRNSGARAVVEGVGDHGCEYMTGGTVVVLGRTGRNFGAGMSGGVAYVLDVDGHFARRCNREMVELSEVRAGEDVDALRTLIAEHASLTGSAQAARLLADWPAAAARFVMVMPVEYRRALAARATPPAQEVARGEAYRVS